MNGNLLAGEEQTLIIDSFKHVFCMDRRKRGFLPAHGHAAMTGAEAVCNAKIEGTFQAWGGYIEGRNLELQENARIVQAWRTRQFSESEPDSRVEITLKADGDSTEVTITHTELPEHGMQYLQGWADFYFSPMRAYFS